MILEINITVITICGILKGILDKISEGDFNQSYWNKDKSWMYKWKIGINGYPIVNYRKPWYYLGLYKPSHIERFWWSSTILVSLTDGWHLIQAILLHIVMLSVSSTLVEVAPDKYIITINVVKFLIYSIVFRVVFELSHKFSWFTKK